MACCKCSIRRPEGPGLAPPGLLRIIRASSSSVSSRSPAVGTWEIASFEDGNSACTLAKLASSIGTRPRDRSNLHAFESCLAWVSCLTRRKRLSFCFWLFLSLGASRVCWRLTSLVRISRAHASFTSLHRPIMSPACQRANRRRSIFSTASCRCFPPLTGAARRHLETKESFRYASTEGSSAHSASAPRRIWFHMVRADVGMWIIVGHCALQTSRTEGSGCGGCACTDWAGALGGPWV